jgi:hypothetical protein
MSSRFSDEALSLSRLEEIFDNYTRPKRALSRGKPWCDCPENQKLNGVTHAKRYSEEGRFFEAATDDDGNCIHCEHFAIISVLNPSEGYDGQD